MSELKNAVREAVEKYHAGELEVKRFTISLTSEDNARLDRLAKQMELTRQGVISLLLPPALRDLEIELERKE